MALLLGMAAGRCLLAGREFLAGRGEQVMPDQLVVGLQPGADINQVLASAAPQAVASLVGSDWNIYLLRLPPGVQAAASTLLAAHPLVDFVEPNRLRHATVLPPNDSLLTQQWALTTIQAVEAWSYFPDRYLTAANPGANRVKVAILDTGVDCTHPDFMNAGGTSTDAAQGGQLAWALSQAPTPTTIGSPACPWEDDNGHGTHTAGILAAATNNATGVASLGFPLELIVIKVLDSTGYATDATVASAIATAVGEGAQVISMSLAGPGYSQTLQTAMDSAWQHNVLVVAAAGNTGDTTLQYPGAGNHALGVAASDTTNAAAGFSTYGNWVKIAAPGVNIESTLPTYGGAYGANYGMLSGTSLSTPFVAALGGLLYMANPGLSVAAIAQRIQQTAQTPGSGWDPHVGYGVIDAGAALGGIPGPATEGSLTGQVVDQFNNPVTGATVTAGGQSFTTALDPTTGDPNGLFRIPNLSPGTYAIAVTEPGHATVNLQGAIVAGADTMLTIPIGVSLGEFTGAVTWNGTAVAGAVVEAISSGLVQATAITNISGSYALYVKAGTYTLTASAPNYIDTTSGSHALSGGGTVTVNLALSALGNLIGTVVDINGLGVANAHIDFTSAGFSGGAATGAGGSYSTFGIPSGTYTVTASASGYSNASPVVVSVIANTSTPVNFRFSTGVSLASGLLGHWPFDEGSGTVAHDASGNGQNAALIDTTWITGLFGSGLSFNGFDSEGITPAISLGGAFSISAWVNPAATTQIPYAAIAETNYRTGLYLGVDPTGAKYKFIVNSGTGSAGTCGGPDGCAQGGAVTSGWHLVSGTYDGATALLYVDGVVAASDTAAAPANAGFPLEMGRSYVAAVSWNGNVDEMRLYSRALTASEVASLYAQGTAPNLSLTKTADAATVAAGTPIGYTLAVTNNGAAAATAVMLNDPLPVGTGIGWSISPAYSGPGTCAVSLGTLGCSLGSVSPGAGATVHLTSATAPSSCGAYTNTATLTAGNNSALESSATTTVECSQTIAFGPLPNVTFGTAPFTLSATASSGLAVSFNSQTPAVCAVSGATVTLVAVGACTIQATQAGNASYAAATPVNQSFLVTARCDVNRDGTTNVADVQQTISEALGLAQAAHDLNGDGVVNVADVQIVINAVLGLGCSGS